MSKKIVVELDDIKFSAILLETEEPELCEILWNDLEKPMKMIGGHTLSTGNLAEGFARPSREPVKTGTQANPVGRKKWMLSQLEPGMIIYDPARSIHFCYGETKGTITEPLLANSSVVAKVDEEDLDRCNEIGKRLWNSHFNTHCLEIMTVKREERKE